jgi:sugar lactone lactonase YvrE
MVRKVTAAGVVTTLAGSAALRGSLDGTGAAATFNAPGGIAVDAAGVVYVADSMNATIRKITAAGVVSTLAGTPGSHGTQDGVGANARFNYPGNLAVDAAGTVYVADVYNSTIRKIAADGSVVTLAGLGGVTGSTDALGSNALFNQANGLTVGSTGTLWVADTGNSTIRKITPAGAVTTLAGLPGIAGLVSGSGTTALFNQPRGLCVDGAGSIFVADTGNAAMRKIASDGTVTTLVLTEAAAPSPGGGTTTPPPVTTPPPSSSGGGGGAMGIWFGLTLAILAAARGVHRTRARNECGP